MGKLENAGMDEGVKVLASWFRDEFFALPESEVPCRVCRAPVMRRENAGPTGGELRLGATRVDLFTCSACGAGTRCPQYASVAKLLEVRVGGVAEWASCFAALLVAYGVDVRVVLDWTGHCWCEVWSEARGRYVHVDPAENVVDRPLLYEVDLGKELLWVVAVNDRQCVDVTARYTRERDAVIARRSALLGERYFAQLVSLLQRVFLVGASDEEVARVEERQARDLCDLESDRGNGGGSGDGGALE